MPLDASAYPHILDRILNYASPNTLLAFRATSRDFHERASRRLFEHITLTSFDGPVLAIVPAGSSLRFEYMDGYSRARLPPPPPKFDRGDFLARARVRTYIHRMVKLARVFDQPPHLWYNRDLRLNYDQRLPELRGVPVHRSFVYGVFTIAGSRCSIAYRHPHIDMARLLDIVACRPQGEEVVVHLLQGHRELYLGHDGEMPKHLTIVGGAQSCRSAAWLAPNAGNDELEAVLRDPALISAYAPRDFGSSSDPHLHEALPETACPSGSSTLWKPGSLDEAARWDHFDRRMGHFLEPREQRDRSKLLSGVETLRFLSPEEYADKVGEAQVALETKANPYVGPPAVYLP
jgi:hypothetical protein